MTTRTERSPIPHRKGSDMVLRVVAAGLGSAAVVGGIVGGMKIAGIGPFESSSPSQEDHQGLVGGAPSETAFATQVVEALKPTPTATETIVSTPAPEVKKDVPCQILPEKFCSQAELIEFNYQGKTYTYVGFRLPSGVPLLSPMDGQVAKAEIVQPSPYKGFLATVMDPNNPTSGSFGFVGDLKFPNMLSINIKKGDIIGYAQNTETENFGNYNLLVGASNSDSLRSLFPEAFKKPAKKATYDGLTATTYMDIYADEPPSR